MISYGTSSGALDEDGVAGCTSDGSGMYASFFDSASSASAGGSLAASPCVAVSLGQAFLGSTGAFFCDSHNLNADTIYEKLGNDPVHLIAAGTPRKFLVDGSTAYVSTIDSDVPEV